MCSNGFFRVPVSLLWFSFFFLSIVRLKFKRGGRGRLPSAVGPRELFQVIEAMYRGKGEPIKFCLIIVSRILLDLLFFFLSFSLSQLISMVGKRG